MNKTALQKWFVIHNENKIIYKFSYEFFQGWYGARFNEQATKN